MVLSLPLIGKDKLCGSTTFDIPLAYGLPDSKLAQAPRDGIEMAVFGW